MRIVQIVPELRTGSGVEAVAYHLEKEWLRLGIACDRFTMREARGDWIPTGRGLAGRVWLAARVIWFSCLGTVFARQWLAREPRGTIAICHNDVLAGDVYVNHGNVLAAMRARGHAWARVARNPLHLFTIARDALRYRSNAHRCVVNLTPEGERELTETFGRIAPEQVVIGNGVDIDRFQPDPELRERTRAELGLDGAFVAVFVGHEYGRKGLPTLIDALAIAGEASLVVVGGDQRMQSQARVQAHRLGVEHRVIFVGPQSDPRPYLAAADVFALPTLYEAYPLVVLEALASGLPVVTTRAGAVDDLIADGANGFVVDRTPAAVARGIDGVRAGDPAAMGLAARHSAERRSWQRVAQDYVALFERILKERDG